MPEYAGWIPQSNCKHKIPSPNIPVKTRTFSYRQVCIVPLTLPVFWQENATRTCGCCSNQKPQLTATTSYRKTRARGNFATTTTTTAGYKQKRLKDFVCILSSTVFFRIIFTWWEPKQQQQQQGLHENKDLEAYQDSLSFVCHVDTGPADLVAGS